MYRQPLGNQMLRSSGGVRFDLGLLLQGQTMATQYKSASILLIIGSRGLQCTVNHQLRIFWWCQIWPWNIPSKSNYGGST